ncbi:hypothetical protein BT96DRAFT_984159 [Gymnopus androsaceus JB14]|uniref:Zn(2)-C6 fungal-type domain-containing protein n=1 Tax=Gymnopus androsaceus JB14 TaxID=1447944 RepID=A0A6A4IC92_9AGAR|nr:hypothetical protein BT96DRAFT_984159 [Gymnopus androsaceus JB14]
MQEPLLRAAEALNDPGKPKPSQNRSKLVSTCRKHKTRCEILDGLDQQVIRCHRCKVLKVQCSYQGMNRAVFEAALAAKSEHGEITNTAVYGLNDSSPATTNSPGASNAFLHPRMFPNHPHHIWNFLQLPRGVLDWSAPLEAIQGLTKQVLSNSHSRDHHSPSPPPAILSDSLESIFSPDQIDHLVSIFEHNYLPWLNFTLIRERPSPLLDLVCCTIASRHLTEPRRSIVAVRLQALATENAAKMIMQSRRSETLEAIQCLLILSLWAPVCGSSEDSRDGRLLIASAVTMALDMRLNDACELAMTLRDAHLRGEDVTDQEMLDASSRARLWIALTNAESLLCDRCLYSRQIFLASDLISARDTRLRLLAEMFDIVEAGINIRLESLSDVDVESWYDGFAHVLSGLDRITRLLVPLHLVAEFDEFYFQTLHIIERTCRSLVLYQACFTVRQYFVRSGNDHPFWFNQIRPHGLNALLIWGKEAVAVSESVLISFLEADVNLLGTMPDYIFNMDRLRFDLYHRRQVPHHPKSRGRLSWFDGETSLIEAYTKLKQCSLSPDSAAMKCSTLITGMLALWENKMAQQEAEAGS